MVSRRRGSRLAGSATAQLRRNLRNCQKPKPIFAMPAAAMIAHIAKISTAQDAGRRSAECVVLVRARGPAFSMPAEEGQRRYGHQRGEPDRECGCWSFACGTRVSRIQPNSARDNGLPARCSAFCRRKSEPEPASDLLTAIESLASLPTFFAGASQFRRVDARRL